MASRKVKLLLAFVLLIIPYHAALCIGPQQNLMNQLNLISANRDSNDFLSLTILILGPPYKMFRHSGYDVWFYPNLSSSLSDKPLKNVYLFIKGGKIVSVKSYNQDLNPYTGFESYP